MFPAQNILKIVNTFSIFFRISQLEMVFAFQVNYTGLHRSNSPDCYQFNIKVKHF